MSTKISVCLEVGSESTGAFAPSCPGCWVFGRTPESALRKVKVAVAEWFEWLEKHDEYLPTQTKEFEVEVAEMLTVNYNPAEAGKPEPLFWCEVLPVNRKDIARTIRLMKYSREDLLERVSGLSSERLDWQPPNKPRTTRNCLRHIAHVEPWYITRLNVNLRYKQVRNVFRLLDHTRKAVLNYLEKFPRKKMHGVFQPKKDQSPICNLWTARKVLRRLVDHERLHAKYIERALQEHKKSSEQ